MMKRTALIAIAVSLLTAAPAASALAVAPGKPAAAAAAPAKSAEANRVAANAMPFFGGIKMTPKQEAHNKKVVAEAIRRAGSREKAEQVALQLGWEKIKSGDSVTGVKYFNLAWLIDPKNPEVLHGFGIAMAQQHNYPASLKIFDMACKRDPNNAALLTDYAYVWIGKGATADEQPAQREASFSKALELLDASEKLDPKNPRVYSNRAMIRFFQARYAEAWTAVERAEAIAPRSVDPRFLHDLSSRMPRPAKK